MRSPEKKVKFASFLDTFLCYDQITPNPKIQDIPDATEAFLAESAELKSVLILEADCGKIEEEKTNPVKPPRYV